MLLIPRVLVLVRSATLALVFLKLMVGLVLVALPVALAVVHWSQWRLVVPVVLTLVEHQLEVGLGTEMASNLNGRRATGISTSNHSQALFSNSDSKSESAAITGTVAIANPSRKLCGDRWRTILKFRGGESESGSTVLSQLYVDILYFMLETIDDVFTKANVSYSTSGGTTLGAIRHGGLIPWDDDADLVVYDLEAILDEGRPERRALQNAFLVLRVYRDQCQSVVVLLAVSLTVY